MLALDEQFHHHRTKAQSNRRKGGFGLYSKSPTASVSSVNSVACNHPNGGLSGNIPNGTTDDIWQGWQTMEERNPFGRSGRGAFNSDEIGAHRVVESGLLGVGTAYEIISTIERAMRAACTGYEGLSKYKTGPSRQVYAAKLARSLRQYNAAIARCACKCGSVVRE